MNKYTVTINYACNNDTSACRTAVITEDGRIVEDWEDIKTSDRTLDGEALAEVERRFDGDARKVIRRAVQAVAAGKVTETDDIVPIATQNVKGANPFFDACLFVSKGVHPRRHRGHRRCELEDFTYTLGKRFEAWWEATDVKP